MSEKLMTVGFGKRLVTGFSAPIDAADFKEGKDFIEAVTSAFGSEWDRVKGEVAKSSELPPYDPEKDVEVIEIIHSEHSQRVMQQIPRVSNTNDTLNVVRHSETVRDDMPLSLH
eukprot:scaffold259727_cov36-Prasinocladus_malaysianus.AAC.1